MTDLAREVGAPAAGWYPDPADPASKRWWSGEGWTEHVQPAVVAAVPAVAAPVVAAPVVPAPVPQAVVVAQPAYVAPTFAQAAPVQPPAPQTLNSSNLDASGVPLNLFADSVFTADVLAPPTPRPDTQSDWHTRGGRTPAPKRGAGGSVSLSTGVAGVSSRKANPYERNWIAGVALFFAILSIPALGVRALVELPPITQSIFAGGPIAISLLALAMSFRRGSGVVVSIIATVLAGGVLAAGLLIDPVVLKSIVDSVMALLP